MDVCFSFWFSFAVTSRIEVYFFIVIYFQYSPGISSLRIVVEYDLDQQQVKLTDTLLYPTRSVTPQKTLWSLPHKSWDEDPGAWEQGQVLVPRTTSFTVTGFNIVKSLHFCTPGDGFG